LVSTDFAAQYPARTFPCQRFTPDLTIDGASLGAGVGRWPFTVRNFHSLHLAGFDRRTDTQMDTCRPLAILFVVPAVRK
jgi:hypothetical protein